MQLLVTRSGFYEMYLNLRDNVEHKTGFRRFVTYLIAEDKIRRYLRQYFKSWIPWPDHAIRPNKQRQAASEEIRF